VLVFIKEINEVVQVWKHLSGVFMSWQSFVILESLKIHRFAIASWLEIANSDVSEKLQLQPDLMLEKAPRPVRTD